MRENVHFQYYKFQKGHNSYKNWRKSTTLELDIRFIKRKSKFQPNMSMHILEKCGKLHIRNNLKLKRCITPAKIDGNWWHSNLILRALKKSHTQISAQYVKACRRKVRKTVTDGDPNGHHHTIIHVRPIWGRAYNNSCKRMLS